MCLQIADGSAEKINIDVTYPHERVKATGLYRCKIFMSGLNLDQSNLASGSAGPLSEGANQFVNAATTMNCMLWTRIACSGRESHALDADAEDARAAETVNR